MALNEAKNVGEEELERTLDLKAALAIGVGAMIGGGIFIFPGMAAGRAGPAATLSFAIGGAIAMLVALPASELATAMPRSGGVYYFVNRASGSFLGNIVGVSMWLGLIFASAFYLVGFGHYASELLADAGVGPRAPVLYSASCAVALLVVSIMGTRKAGLLQTVFVVLLLSILSFFIVFGIINALGVTGVREMPGEFAPFGLSPILTTSAFVFTSYLGFEQIATMAGDIKEPERTLPRAMILSVLIVTALYIGTIFIATSLFTNDRLAGFGETAMVEIARSLIGIAGAVSIIIAGILATVSSANASVLGASRTSFSMSRDGLMPRMLARINERFKTPHTSLLLVGIPVIILVSVGRLETLAEVASVLHLVLYGLICFSLIALRRRNPEWYRPTFRAPLYPVLPAMGGIACFALILFMEPRSIVLGLGIMVSAVFWYFIYRKFKSGKERGGEK